MSLAEKCTFTMVLLCGNELLLMFWNDFLWLFIHQDHDNSCRCVTNDVVCELFKKWEKNIVKKGIYDF